VEREDRPGGRQRQDEHRAVVVTGGVEPSVVSPGAARVAHLVESLDHLMRIGVSGDTAPTVVELH